MIRTSISYNSIFSLSRCIVRLDEGVNFSALLVFPGYSDVCVMSDRAHQQSVINVINRGDKRVFESKNSSFYFSLMLEFVIEPICALIDHLFTASNLIK